VIALAVKAAVLAATAGLVTAACGASAQPTRPDNARTVPSRPADPVTRTVPSGAPAHAALAVQVARTAYGPALVDRRGFALYRFTHDRTSSSTCYAACASAWPPYVVKRRPAAAGRGAHLGLLGSVRRRDGRLQVTYAGHPLYYYVGDRRPRQVLCQAVTEYGGTWYVVAADGDAIR
jgi:predicted lipoprotein with Yx(FWY)xxD motif